VESFSVDFMSFNMCHCQATVCEVPPMQFPLLEKIVDFKEECVCIKFGLKLGKTSTETFNILKKQNNTFDSIISVPPKNCLCVSYLTTVRCYDYTASVNDK
jgi:hypothetical protein